MTSLTILGGGNTAFAVAANLALRGFAVTLCEHPDFAWTLDPVRADKRIQLDGVAESGSALIERVTTSAAEALENDLLLLIVPAYAHRAFAELCAPHLRDGHIVVITPGTLGALEFAQVGARRGQQQRHPLRRDRHRALRLPQNGAGLSPHLGRRLWPGAGRLPGNGNGDGRRRIAGNLHARRAQRPGDRDLPVSERVRERAVGDEPGRAPAGRADERGQGRVLARRLLLLRRGRHADGQPM